MEIPKAEIKGIERQGFQVDREFVAGLETHERHRYWRPDIKPSGGFTTPLPCDQTARANYLATKDMGGKGFLWNKPPDPGEPLVEPVLDVPVPKKKRAKRKTRSK